jgi:hypothetical protein
MERRASLSSGKREVERIGTRIKKLLNLMLDDGIAVDEGKTEIKALDARRKELQAQLDTANEPPTLLHPEMAELYRQKVTTLAHALEAAETRTEAREALRGLIDVITITPEQGVLRIELKGNLAAMLGATVQSKRSPETGDLSLQVSMVAGAGFEPCVTRSSKLVMARDFWSKGLVSRDLRSSSRCSRVLRRPPQSPAVLETFWRRRSSLEYSRNDPAGASRTK